jgi:acetyl esterase/lipase
MASWQFGVMKLLFRLKRLLQPGTPNVVQRRQEYERLTSRFKLNPQVTFTPGTINGVAALWVDPSEALSDRVILFFHGGAYCLCSVNTHRAMTAAIAEAVSIRVLSLDYRLAPEHPFPAAVEDAVSAYYGLLDMGIAPEHIIVAGDSAGGGLTLTLLLSLRDAGAPLPAAAVCISPWTDLSLSGESFTVNAKKDVMLDTRTLVESAQMYLGSTDPQHPLASPLFGDFHNLPPLLIQVGSDEIILSDAEGVAEKAQQAGVDVTLEVWPGMQHEWHFASDFVPEGQAAIACIGAFIQENLT